MEKDPRLLDILARLRRDLGPDYFRPVPHWDGDLLATGLGRPDDPDVLVYVSVDPGGLYVECETPTGDDSPLPYEVTTRIVDATYEQVLAAVRAHLAH